MEKVKVRSSNIEAIGYDAATKELEIDFQGGTSYTYSGIPKELHEQFMAAESKGKFFHVNIRSKFAFKKAPDGVKGPTTQLNEEK